jgi:hypothetical protein
MSPISVSTEVARSASEVFAYATDPSRFHEWQAGVLDGRIDNPDALKVGARCVTTRRIGFADRASTSELVYLDAPRTWGTQGLDGPIRATVDVGVEPLAEDRARLTISLDFQGYGIGRLLVPLAVRPAARKEMPANLAALKHNLERST